MAVAFFLLKSAPEWVVIDAPIDLLVSAQIQITLLRYQMSDNI